MENENENKKNVAKGQIGKFVKNEFIEFTDSPILINRVGDFINVNNKPLPHSEPKRVPEPKPFYIEPYSEDIPAKSRIELQLEATEQWIKIDAERYYKEEMAKEDARVRREKAKETKEWFASLILILVIVIIAMIGSSR
jgi:hypothetical protein